MYTLIETVAILDGIPVPMYGIEGGGAKFPCLSVSREKVSALLLLCNTYGASPVHIEDIAEDFLYE